MKATWIVSCMVVASAVPVTSHADDHQPKNSPEGWTAESPRDEIRPHFSYEAGEGPIEEGCFVISARNRPRSIGRWTHTFPVVGGQHFAFRAMRETKGIETPRRETFVRITWQDDRGKLVLMGPNIDLSFGNAITQLAKPRPSDTEQEPSSPNSHSRSWRTKARQEYPADSGPRSDGWTEFADVYQVPPGASQAKTELCFRATREGTVRWSEVSFTEISPPVSRKVRLATVNLKIKRQPTALDVCCLFEAPIAEAARQQADLVCLTEMVTYFGTGSNGKNIAEPIPGPSTEYFGKLAKRHDLYIIVGLTERDGVNMFNVSVLIGPDGNVAGKYRKVCMDRNMAIEGFAEGQDYPVFETRFGKVGMMICWDLMFPEVARNLSNNGAEVIALAIAGGEPTLARARAIENQVYLVSSSLGGHGLECGIFDYEGKLLGEAKDPGGSVSVVEIDLNKRQYWYWLGDVKSQIVRQRPANGFPE